MARDLNLLDDQLDYKVNKISMGLHEKNLPGLMLEVESRAAQLKDSAGILDR